VLTVSVAYIVEKISPQARGSGLPVRSQMIFFLFRLFRVGKARLTRALVARQWRAMADARFGFGMLIAGDEDHHCRGQAAGLLVPEVRGIVWRQRAILPFPSFSSFAGPIVFPGIV
jgi:hypothetical protein